MAKQSDILDVNVFLYQSKNLVSIHMRQFEDSRAQVSHVNVQPSERDLNSTIPLGHHGNHILPVNQLELRTEIWATHADSFTLLIIYGGPIRR